MTTATMTPPEAAIVKLDPASARTKRTIAFTMMAVPGLGTVAAGRAVAVAPDRCRHEELAELGIERR